jgi:dephospho-CoA kinase
MRNIALAGGMGSGKSEIARFMVESYGYEKRAFSDPLYDIAVRLWGEEARKDRARLQDLGMKMREIDVWLNCYMRETEGLEGIVCDGLRFPNEFWALKEAGWYIVRVMAPESVRVDRLQKIGRIQEIDRINHESETALYGVQREAEGIHFDRELNNDTDKVNMELEVRNLMNKIESEE